LYGSHPSEQTVSDEVKYPSQAPQKLERIYQLWKELERMEPNTSESEAVMKKIRALSAEYQALIDAPQKPKASK
jgi:hypothetical protein